MAYYDVPTQKILLDFCWTFGIFVVPKSASHGAILLRILNCQSSNNTRFLSIISPILAIYWETSFTFSHLSIRPSGYTLFEILPAPQATMVCTSSIINHFPHITAYHTVLSSIFSLSFHGKHRIIGYYSYMIDVLLMYCQLF